MDEFQWHYSDKKEPDTKRWLFLLVQVLECTAGTHSKSCCVWLCLLSTPSLCCSSSQRVWCLSRLCFLSLTNSFLQRKAAFTVIEDYGVCISVTSFVWLYLCKIQEQAKPNLQWQPMVVSAAGSGEINHIEAWSNFLVWRKCSTSGFDDHCQVITFVKADQNGLCT